jgi:hypothetical protein
MIGLTTHQQNNIDRILTDGGAGVERIISEIDGDDTTAEAARLAATAQAVAEVFKRCIVPTRPRLTATRLLLLAMHLSPDLLKSNQSDCARDMGVTRAHISKVSISIGEEFQVLRCARWHKRSTVREKYRVAQHRAVRLGHHASDLRPKKNRKPKGVS